MPPVSNCLRSAGLHQRRYHLGKSSGQLVHDRLFFDAVISDLSALCESILEIRFDFRDAVRLIHICRAFEVMIKAPVIEIYRPYYSLDVVTDEHLGMNESRSIFIYLHSCVMQQLIVRLGK